jgi:hypothetical protein
VAGEIRHRHHCVSTLCAEPHMPNSLWPATIPSLLEGGSFGVETPSLAPARRGGYCSPDIDSPTRLVKNLNPLPPDAPPCPSCIRENGQSLGLKRPSSTLGLWRPGPRKPGFRRAPNA